MFGNICLVEFISNTSVIIHILIVQNSERFEFRPPQLHFFSRVLITSQLTGKILEYANAQGQNALLFMSQKAADECVAFATAAARGHDKMSADEIAVRIFDIDVRIYAVFFPAPKMPFVMPFWNHPGVGVSSRLAEGSLKHLDLLHEVTSVPDTAAPKVVESPAHAILRERIAELLEVSGALFPFFLSLWLKGCCKT